MVLSSCDKRIVTISPGNSEVIESESPSIEPSPIESPYTSLEPSQTVQPSPSIEPTPTYTFTQPPTPIPTETPVPEKPEALHQNSILLLMLCMGLYWITI